MSFLQQRERLWHDITQHVTHYIVYVVSETYGLNLGKSHHRPL